MFPRNLACFNHTSNILDKPSHVNTGITMNQGPDFDDMSSFFPCEIDDAIQYINLGYGAQAPKIVILYCIVSSFFFYNVCNFSVIFLSYFQGLLYF